MPNDDADGDGSNNTVTVNAPTEEDGKTAIFSFGSITFDTPGTYVYKVTEVTGGNVGIDYSSNKATITIEVVDNHQGALVATVGIENNVFTNTYASELDYAAGGGLKIIKTFENADMREFNFTVTPKNEALPISWVLTWQVRPSPLSRTQLSEMTMRPMRRSW